MNLIDRMKAPTPKWFKVLRNIGIGLAAAGGALIAAPIALPVAVTTLAGYMLVTGTTIGAVAQSVVENQEE